MRYYVALAAVSVVAGALLAPAGASAAVPAASRGVRAGGGWGTAEEVPGLAALSRGHGAELRALSCGAAGSCAAGGAILHGRSEVEAWVAGESNGTWRAAEQVPGLAALNTGRGADIYSLSCGAAGDCAAGGFYHDASGHAQAFVVNETNGTWGTARQVPGLAALNTGGNARVASVSCASAGSCAATGEYTVISGHQQVFVVSETNGTWGTAEPVRGLPPIKARGLLAEMNVSCGAAGDCAAGGFYTSPSNDAQAFVVNQTSGTWGTAEQVPGLAALNTGGNAAVTSLSCASAASCAAAGSYSTSRNHRQAFVADETSGTWGTAQQIPGLAALSKGNDAELDDVSCASAGNCAAGGDYVHYPHRSARTEVFVANEASGTWGTAEQVPGITALNNGGQGDTLTYSVSCGAAGSCSDVGSYQDSAGHLQAFAADQSNGTWHTAQQIPGTAALNQGGTAVAWSVSCASAGSCAAGGDYTDASGREQAFVVTKT